MMVSRSDEKYLAASVARQREKMSLQKDWICKATLLFWLFLRDDIMLG